MYGMMQFTVSSDQLYYSNNQDPVLLGQVNMLRSLAKIRVIDNIASKNPEIGFPRIEEATIYTPTRRAYIMPANAENFFGQEEDVPNSYEPPTSNLYPLKLGYLNSNTDVFFGYLPEQTITTATPYLKLTIALDEDSDGNLITKVYDVPMSGYNGVDFRENFGQYILRNHIYTLSIDDVAVDTPLTMDISVAEWAETSFELDFSQSLNVESKLSFSNEASIDYTNGNIVFKEWTTTAEGGLTYSPITCRFAIQTPIGATWRAYLNTIEGEQDAFAFLDNNGELQPHLTGIINNQYESFRVVTLNPSPEVMNKAKLQIYVQFADNTMTEVPLTPDNFKNYIFVQNPQ